MQLCPVCAWEDTLSEAAYTNSNEIDLIPAQRHFLATGACEDEYLSVVRPPLPEEARSNYWMSSDELRLKVITEIELQFHDVKREGGNTLHQIEYLENYVLDEELMRKAELKDPEIAWQEIPGKKLGDFSLWLSLLDDPGFRFHLPAFMRQALASGYPEFSYATCDEILWSLQRGPAPSWNCDRFAMLTAGQKEIVAAFVSLFAIFGCNCQRPYAIEGLQNGWAAFIPDFLKLALS